MPVALATAIVGASTGIAFTLVSTVISVGLSYLAKQLFTPGGGQEDEAASAEQGILTNKVGNINPIPVIYGYRKVGGNKVFQSVTNDNKDFWMVIVIGEGPTEGIQNIYIDDDLLELNHLRTGELIFPTGSQDSTPATEILQSNVDDKFRYKITSIATGKESDWVTLGSLNPPTVGDVFQAIAPIASLALLQIGSCNLIRNRYVGKCQFFTRNGDLSAAPDGTNRQTSIVAKDFAATSDQSIAGTDKRVPYPYFPAQWDAGKRLLGLSYVMCKFTYDRDTFRGIPNVTFDMKGVKTPNIGKKTLVSVNSSGVKTTVTPDIIWERNPAAILYDYLTNPVYGRGISLASMDLPSFESAYAACEIPLPIFGTNTSTTLVKGTQYRISSVTSTDWSSVGGSKTAIVGQSFTCTVAANAAALLLLGIVNIIDADTAPENVINVGTRYKITSVAAADWSGVGGSKTAYVGQIFTGTVVQTIVQLALLGTVNRILPGVAPPKSLEGILGQDEHKLYRLDGVVNVNDNTFNNTKKILSACRGFLIFSAGKYKMVIDKFENDYSRFNVLGIAQVPSVTPFLFNEDNTVGAIDITLGDKSNTYNRARYSFYNPQKNWQFDTLYFDDAITRKNEDRGITLEQSVRMDFVASRYCAQEIVRQNLRQSRQQIIVGFQTNISALANDVGDIVDVTNENAGWTLKQFRILKMELQEDGNVKIVMVEYDPAVYDQSADGLIFENDAPDTELPNPFSTSLVPALPIVTNANLTGKNANGTSIQIGRVKVSWPEVLDPFIDYYELQYAAMDQKSSALSSVVLGGVYEIATITSGSTNWVTVGGPSIATVGDVFISTTAAGGSGVGANPFALGTVLQLTQSSDGYSTVSIPSTQKDVSNNIIEFVENLSPTSPYAFRTRYVRTNSVYSGYSPVQSFITTGVSGAAGADGKDGVSPILLRMVTEHQRYPTGAIYDPAPAYFIGNKNYTGIHAVYGDATEKYEFGQRVIAIKANSKSTTVTRDGVWQCNTAGGCDFGTFDSGQWTDTLLSSTSVGELQYRLRAILTEGNTDITSNANNAFTWLKDNVPRQSGKGSTFSVVEIDASNAGNHGGIVDNGANVWEVRVDTGGTVDTTAPTLANTQEFNTQLFTQ